MGLIKTKSSANIFQKCSECSFPPTERCQRQHIIHYSFLVKFITVQNVFKKLILFSKDALN